MVDIHCKWSVLLTLLSVMQLYQHTPSQMSVLLQWSVIWWWNMYDVMQTHVTRDWLGLGRGT